MVYYLNTKKQPSSSGSNYEVHAANCNYCPEDKSKTIYLGDFLSASEAIIYAKQNYINMAFDIDGCFFCCKGESHR